MVSGKLDEAIVVYAEDINGNLDEVIFDLTQVEPVKSSGEIDTTPVEKESVRGGFYGIAEVRFRPTKSGLVYFKACDDDGACSSNQSIFVSVSDARGNHTPQIINYTLRENEDYSALPIPTAGSSSAFSADFTIFDPDGDLYKVYLSWENITTGATGTKIFDQFDRSGDYFNDDSFEINGFNEDGVEFIDFDDVGRDDRGNEYQITLTAIDHNQNSIEQSNSLL